MGSASSTRTVVIHWCLSKMTTLHSLAGKRKQIDSKGDSDVLKAVGIGKTKRRIIKRIKQRFEIQVKSDTDYTFIHKLFNDAMMSHLVHRLYEIPNWAKGPS